ncbi:MAG: hypothetical protein AAB372_01335 [Patescibacteria group bacterium]
MKIFLKIIASILFIYGSLSVLTLILLLYVRIMWSLDDGALRASIFRGVLPLVEIAGLAAGSFVVGRYFWKKSEGSTQE